MSILNNQTWHPDMPEEYRNQIVTGDARELAKAIPDESIDLIFTDPVYDRIDDYRWLAETAARALKPGGACLVWCSKLGQYDVKMEMENHLKFALPISYVVYGKSFRLMYYQTFIKETPLLWFFKDAPNPRGWLVDTMICHNGSTRWIDGVNYRWAKHPDFMMQYLGHFSDEGSIVFDPFTGGGTVPAVCKMLGRNYIAFEIDPDTADNARERVLNTQPPLFVLEPEQMELTL